MMLGCLVEQVVVLVMQISHKLVIMDSVQPSNGTLGCNWNWTQGGTKANSLAANDFFGATANDKMYIDDYQLEDLNCCSS